MSADVLAQARAAGVELLIYDGRLASRGPATPKLQAAIRARKPELIALLTSTPQRWPELLPLGNQADRRRWIDRPDAITVVEDLANDGWRPGKISRTLGLHRDEVLAILRRTGR